MAFRKVNDDSLATVAAAIRAKGGTTEPLAFPDGFVAAISDIEAGGGGAVTPSAKWGDVTFIDYDGSVLYSYSLSEAQALTELPPLPEHDGLICQGWNWSLQSIKALNREVTVGAMYITDDGATRLHIRIATVGRMDVPLYIGQTVANGVTIDWGDGSEAETLSGTGYVNTTHTYAEPGYYTISLMPEDGCTLSLGAVSSGTGYCVMGSTNKNNRVYCNMLKSVSIGKNVPNINNAAFAYCESMERITIPSNVTSFSNAMFLYCRKLNSITIPNRVLSIPPNFMAYCYSLEMVSIPDGVTLIDNYAFSSCFNIKRILLPNKLSKIGSIGFDNNLSLAIVTFNDGIKSIMDCAFRYCYGMRYFDFSACKSVPTLPYESAFTGIPSDCKMLIPSALYDEWSKATNWATYASYMVAV